MSDAMETQVDDTVGTGEGDATIPDTTAPAEEISVLNVSTPVKTEPIEDTPDNPVSANLEERPAPVVESSGANNIQEQLPAQITADLCLSHSKTISDTVQFDKEEVVGDSLGNAFWIVCQVCKSKILQPKIGVYHEVEAQLPPLLKKDSLNAATQEIPVEMVTQFWKIKDMFHFENIGVSKTIKNTKYLLCADCEIGPVGYHDITNPQAFFLAANRVVYAKSL